MAKASTARNRKTASTEAEAAPARQTTAASTARRTMPTGADVRARELSANEERASAVDAADESFRYRRGRMAERRTTTQPQHALHAAEGSTAVFASPVGSQPRNIDPATGLAPKPADAEETKAEETTE